MNCHGCKWLDRYKTDGNGYCCKVQSSKTQRSKIRRPEMERCELYEAGDWNTRYATATVHVVGQYNAFAEAAHNITPEDKCCNNCIYFSPCSFNESGWCGKYPSQHVNTDMCKCCPLFRATRRG